MKSTHFPFTATPLALLLALSLPGMAARAAEPTDTTTKLRAKVKTVVVIYAENRSFDNLFGSFPGANGIKSLYDAKGALTSAYIPQKDRNGDVLPVLPPTWKGVTLGGNIPVVTQAQSVGLPNAPIALENAFAQSANATLSTDTITRDLAHRFYENQMQINGGRNDMFAAWSDAGGLTMGHFDYSGSAMYKLAQQYVLADNFYQGAFGGSFLNHQYLICACMPEYPDADTSRAKGSITVLNTDANGKYLPQLKTTDKSPASALDGPPVFVLSGNIAPANYLGDGKFYAVNTMQPAYQPSGNAPASLEGGNALYADAAKATTLPPQTAKTIGDMLDKRKIGWKWYAGAWNAGVSDGMQAAAVKRKVIYAGDARNVATEDAVGFQAHHQPFNYYASVDPGTQAAYRSAHLQDYDNLVADAAAGKLPAVAFYKPEGVYNQHEGYANLAAGDARIANLVAKLQASPQWANMVVVITYDEFGGAWDHAAPPKADLVGPGTRIPAIIISPLAKRGTVDHTQYDTGSVLRLITRVFALDPLPGLLSRDAALKANGAPPMGDLTPALQLN